MTKRQRKKLAHLYHEGYRAGQEELLASLVEKGVVYSPADNEFWAVTGLKSINPAAPRKVVFHELAVQPISSLIHQ